MGALFAFFLGVGAAQAIKTARYVAKRRREAQIYPVRDLCRDILRSLGLSGGMPSGHVCSLVSLTTYVAFQEGLGSTAFAICVGVTFWFMYDACNARHAIGEQAKILIHLLEEMREKIHVKVVEGHTFDEVAVGALLGIITGGLAFVLAAHLA